MKLLLDENLPFSFVQSLTESGFVVEHVRNVGLRGALDKEIALYAKNKKYILVTKDLEFGSPLLYPPGSHYSLMILRLPYNCKKEQVLKIITNLLNSVNRTNLLGYITVVELGRYRIRKLP